MQPLQPCNVAISPWLHACVLLQVLLSRHADNQRSFTLGTAWHGRVWGADCEGTVGYFVNPLALVANLTGCESMENGAAVGQRQTGVHSGGTVDLSLAALLQRVAATTKDAFAHSSTPFASVVNAMALPRDLSSTPLFQVGGCRCVVRARDWARMQDWVLPGCCLYRMCIVRKVSKPHWQCAVRHNKMCFVPLTKGAQQRMHSPPQHPCAHYGVGVRPLTGTQP